MKRYLSLLIAFLVLLLGACQPTPDNQIIISRGEVVIPESIEQSADTSNKFPERYQSEKMMISDSLSIQFSADVDRTEAIAYPINSVKKNNFTDQHIFEMINSLRPNADLISKPVLTKTQLAKIIARLENFQNPSLTEQIEAIKSQLETAPQEYSPVKINLLDDNNNDRYTAYVANQDETYTVFYGNRGGNSFCYVRDDSLTILREDILEPVEDAALLQDYQGEFPVSSECALKTAQKVLEELSLSDMRLLDTTKVCTYYYGQLATKGWDFTYTHWNGDLPTLFSFDTVTYGGDNLPLPSLCAPWMPEVVLISVDEQGLICVDIRNLVQQDEQVSTNVTLMDFDLLVEKIAKQLEFRYKYAAEKCEKFEITIREMNLCSSTVTAKDNLDIGKQIPSWLVKYDYYVQIDGTEYTVNESMYFSALDGSYIEPRITNDMLE